MLLFMIFKYIYILYAFLSFSFCAIWCVQYCFCLIMPYLNNWVENSMPANCVMSLPVRPLYRTLLFFHEEGNKISWNWIPKRLWLGVNSFSRCRSLLSTAYALSVNGRCRALPHASNVAITHVGSHVLQMAALIQPASVLNVVLILCIILSINTVSLKDQP